MSERELPVPEDDRDRKLLADIARVGWAVLAIQQDGEGPGYAFSVGLFHTLGHPEIVLMGLPPQTAMQLINSMGEAVRNGQRFEANRRYDQLAKGFPLAFVTVGTQHYRPYLGYARWFYRGSDFPVLQCVWPDKAGHFPWEPDFDGRFVEVQPLLGAWGWEGAWPFTEPPNLATFTVRQVLHDNQPILLVVHDRDGSWQFLTGGPVETADGMVEGLQVMAERDPSLAGLANLPPGWRARRAQAGAVWKRSRVRRKQA
jgi:hypothetical protein